MKIRNYQFKIDDKSVLNYYEIKKITQNYYYFMLKELIH